MRWQHVAALGIWAIATSPSSASSRPDAEHSSDVAITHVSVIDAATGTSRVDQTVTIRGTRIVSVQPSRDTRLPPETRIVDATGKYLVPGLWDSHVHLSYLGACALPVFVANGVTALRDAGARLDEIREWRHQIAAGQLVGPLIKAAGPNLESADWLSRAYRLAPSSDPIWHWGPRLGVDGPGSARGVVDSLARLGVDFVKFRNLPRATFLAVAREAKRRGLPLAGHAPHGTSILEAADSGMTSIEHAETVTLALDTASVSLRRRAFAELVKTGAFLTPTLITERANWLISDSAHRALIDDSTGTRDPDRKYVSARTIDLWREAMELNRKGDDGSTDWNELYRRQVADTRLADEAGVRFLAGTDVGGAIELYAGTSLHDELRLMVRDAGVSPRRALESATTNPAAFFKLERERGTIAPGMAADLVLLDANPLADIDNVRRVRAVVLMGRVLQRADLDQLLAGVAAQVRARRGCAGS